MNLSVLILGKTNFENVWHIQKEIQQRKINKEIEDTLIITEHEPTYTIGKFGNIEHLLISKEELNKINVKLFHIDRGGDITYHGPGQIVGYPILNLIEHKLSLHEYVFNLEEVIIKILNDFGIKGNRLNGYPGVWVFDKKIASIGIKVSKWVTMHGFAINVENDLKYFDYIIPCGIKKPVTSMKNELKYEINKNDVIKKCIHYFSQIFGYKELHIKNDKTSMV
jgi:lipoyl(octanoyl) transferase